MARNVSVRLFEYRCNHGESPVWSSSEKPGSPICEQCGERAAVLLTIADARRWCEECWRWRWAER